MKIINIALCVFLVLSSVIALPTVELTKRKDDKNKIYNISDRLGFGRRLEVNQYGTNIKEVETACDMDSIFEDYYIKEIGSLQSHKSFVNTKSAVFICTGEGEYPVMDKLNIKYAGYYSRYRDKYNRNVMRFDSCPGNVFVVIRCKK
ncbi:hypothetical protein PIROE2DRAFT_17988 [Piromyces sp. E2]|nr:hypothetical protein PIROE2DRAFT_17988 [Piromyces sp. E2]|eukprot:OUM57125.1 hypothetical protein PIROE2DRAFT_17988 [Piromyces sp. E2]